MGKGARLRAARQLERFVEPAAQSERLLVRAAARTDSGILRSAIVRWSEARVVYRLDHSLLDALFTTDLKVMPPREALLHLPHDTFVVAFEEPVEVFDSDDDLTRVYNGVLVNGLPPPVEFPSGRTFFDAISVTAPEAIGIRGTFYGTIKDNGLAQLTTATIPPPGGQNNYEGWTLEHLFDDDRWRDFSVTSYDAQGRQVAVPGDEYAKTGIFAQATLREPLTTLLWQVLLYLASPEPDVVEVVVPDAAPAAVSKSVQRFAGTAVFEVGWRVGAALREAYRRTGEGTQGIGLQARPHVRRGHWHTYLYGPRHADRERRLKWVHPLIVNRDLGPLGGVVYASACIDAKAAGTVGVRYRHADENVTLEFSGEYNPAPDLRGRGARAHAMLQNQFAAALVGRGRTPLSPSPEDPQFDLAWWEGDGLVAVEVKSLGETTETHQLRLGVGQVIEYRWNLAGLWQVPVRSVLFVERAPTTESWAVLCSDEQIVLAWPDTLDDALDALLDTWTAADTRPADT